MTQGYKIFNQDALYFMTFQVVGWVDIFTRKIYRDIIIDGFKFCQKEKGLEIYAYVIMSNHVHIMAKSNKNNLSSIVRDLKRHTSKKILETINEVRESRREWLLMVFKHAASKHTRNNTFQVWTHENQPKEIFSNKFIEQKINYIHQNPVKAGIVEKAEDYLYSSARNYADMENLLEIYKASFRVKTIR